METLEPSNNHSNGRNFQIDISKPEWVDELVDRISKKQKRTHEGIALIVTLLLGILGYSVTWYLDYLNTQKEQLRQDIADKISEYKDLSDAISAFRITREEIVEACQFNPKLGVNPTSVYEANRRRLVAEMNLAEASARAYFAFGNDLVGVINSINDSHDTVKNVCDKDTPTDGDYRKMHMQALQIMRGVIEKEQTLLATEFEFFQ
jgi:hypothetical protein